MRLAWLPERLDRALGDGIERAVRGHHRRRLRRLGWEHALEPPPGEWALGSPPPRRGCSVDVLVDGAEAFSEMAAAVSSAGSWVHVAGWHLAHDFRLSKTPPLSVADVLTEVARRLPVRVLVWAGVPLPPPCRPTRREVRRTGARLRRDGDIRFAVDSRARLLHCHHEKIVVVDDEIAFVGGIDLTHLAGDRLDSPSHPPRGALGWHDATVRLRGPIVADVAEHFRMRWRETTGEELRAGRSRSSAGDVEAQLVRTVPEKVYDSLPQGDFRIAESYSRALRSAERLIYLESQFLWSPEVIGVLAAKLRAPPSPDFRIVLVLPAKPKTGADNSRGQLGVLAEADDGAGRFLACTLYARDGERADPVYVHAKVGIVDDRWLTVGSANLNNHSLFNDTEVNVVTRDPELARRTRLRLWAEHLELPLDEVEGDPARVVDDVWTPVARDQLQRRDAGRPLTHRLCLLPHVSKRSDRLLGPLESVLVDG